MSQHYLLSSFFWGLDNNFFLSPIKSHPIKTMIEADSKIYEKQGKRIHTTALTERTEPNLYKKSYPKGDLKFK